MEVGRIITRNTHDSQGLSEKSSSDAWTEFRTANDQHPDGALDEGDLIKAYIVSRANAINGKYSVGQLGLDEMLWDIRSSDIFYLQTLRMKADFADRMIAEAQAQGKNTDDPAVMKELGQEINAACTPVHRTEAIFTAVFVSLRITAYYGIAIGIWGSVFERSFLGFASYGVVVGLLICLLSVAPVIAFQRTRQRIRDMVFSASAIWGNLGIIICIIGLVAWAVRFVL